MSEIQSEGLSTPAKNANESPSEAYGVPSVMTENAKNPKEGSDWLGGPQNGDETPGNGGNGGNSSGSGDGGDGDATKVGSAYWQF